MLEKETNDLKGISEQFSIPLWTLRKWASERRFPGIIVVGKRRIYVDVKKFREWLYEGEIVYKRR